MCCDCQARRRGRSKETVRSKLLSQTSTEPTLSQVLDTLVTKGLLANNVSFGRLRGEEGLPAVFDRRAIE